MADLIGQRLGPYRLDAVVGRGGMATVYRARQASFDRDVAIKVMDAALSQNDEFLARFEREAQVIARLEHLHILPVIDFGRDGGHVYLVMRLIEGGTLSARLGNGMLSLAQIDRLTAQIASALDYAHQRGIVHRDLKPDNVLLDDADNAYLTDFGIAKMLASTTGNLSLTAAGNLLGTPAYMAPEQWRSEPVDARTDIYALGVILYQMLLGILPFNADTPFGMMFQHVDANPPPPCALNPALPVACERVVLRALAKQPAARYPDVQGLASDLHRAVAGLPPDRLQAALPRVSAEALGDVTMPAPPAPARPAAPPPQAPLRAGPDITPPPVIAAPPPAAPRRGRRTGRLAAALALLALGSAVLVGSILLPRLMDEDPGPPAVVAGPGAGYTPTASPAGSTPALPSGAITLVATDPVEPGPTHSLETPSASCNGFESRMTIGAGGRTTLYPAEGTRVRQSPGFEAPVVRSLPPGLTFAVEGGPVCLDGVLWYEVRGVSAANAWSGWIGEGQGDARWIEPFDTGPIDCPGAPPPRLVPGGTGRVTFDPPLPSRVRSAPTTEGGEANVVTRLQPGKPFDVLSGPVCDPANGWRWWLIRTTTGVEGWIAEGLPGEYWLEPGTGT